MTTRLDRLHGELGHGTGDSGQADELRHVQLLVGGKVRHSHPEQVVRVAEHAAAFDDLVELGHPGLESLHRGRAILDLHRHVDEHLEAAINRGRIDDGAVADDHPRFFEIAHAAQAGRRAETDPLRQLVVRQPAFKLQLGQNCVDVSGMASSNLDEQLSVKLS